MFDAILFVTLDSNKQSTHIFKMENNRGQIYSAFLHMPYIQDVINGLSNF
jgi:hypothetical protein